MGNLTAFFVRAWVLLRDRPFLKCPACGGQGGEVAGYYEQEWQECWACYSSYADAEDHFMEWAVGRIDPLKWPRAKVGEFWHLRCKLGLHQYDREHRICTRCWE